MRHALLVERLQQVIHGVHLERLHRVLIKSGGKNNLGQDYFLVEQFLDDAKAIEARHLHVEKDQVGIVFANEIDAFEPIFALGHDVHVADIFQQKGEFVTGKLFVVHDDCGQRHSNSYGRNESIHRASDIGRQTSDLGPQTSRPQSRSTSEV